MDNNLLVRLEDLVNNPTARVPVCLCLDTSGSMGGMPIDELNEGVRLFYEAIREDETALYSAVKSTAPLFLMISIISSICLCSAEKSAYSLQLNN